MNSHSALYGAKSVTSWLSLLVLKDTHTPVLVLQRALHFLGGGGEGGGGRGGREGGGGEGGRGEERDSN